MTPVRRPWLWDALTRVDLGGGNERTPSELSIRRIPGVWEVVLKDHETGQQTVMVCLTLDGLWDALERHLCDPTIIWRSFKSYRGPGKKAKPK